MHSDPDQKSLRRLGLLRKGENGKKPDKTARAIFYLKQYEAMLMIVKPKLIRPYIAVCMDQANVESLT